jgi:hypothetical protein
MTLRMHVTTMEGVYGNKALSDLLALMASITMHILSDEHEPCAVMQYI